MIFKSEIETYQRLFEGLGQTTVRDSSFSTTQTEIGLKKFEIEILLRTQVLDKTPPSQARFAEWLRQRWSRIEEAVRVLRVANENRGIEKVDGRTHQRTEGNPDDKAKARQEYFAALAARNPRVLQFREDHLSGQTIPEKRIQEWIESFPAGAGTGEYIQYFDIRRSRFSVWRASESPVLLELKQCANHLNACFGWTEPIAVEFILAGVPPVARRIKARVDWPSKWVDVVPASDRLHVAPEISFRRNLGVHQVDIERPSLTITIDHTVQPNELRDWLRTQSPFRNFKQRKVRPPSGESIELFRFLLDRIGPLAKAKQTETTEWLAIHPKSKINTTAKINTHRTRVVDYLRKTPEGLRDDFEQTMSQPVKRKR